MATPTKQQQKTSEYKKLLDSYSVPIGDGQTIRYDTTSTGTYIDVDANAKGAQIAAVEDKAYQIQKGNQPQNAPDFMLVSWVVDLGLGARKTGLFATGNVTFESDPPVYPLTVSKGLQMNVGGLVYVVTQGTVVNSDSDRVPVRAVNVGAEYNIIAGVTLSSSISGYTVKSQGINGGSGRETDPQILNRLLQNIQFRKTDTTLDDYNQKTLQFHNYAASRVIYVTGTPVPYGVQIIAANTIEDYALASQAGEQLNEIALSPSEIGTLLTFFNNERSTKDFVEVTTLQTQNINNALDFHFTSDNVASATTITLIKQAIRKSLLEFQGEKLFDKSLTPDFSGIGITSYSFTTFAPIDRISITMDAIESDISVTQDPNPS